MHPLKRAQIAHLKADKAFTKVFSKYTNFANVFLQKLAIKHPKHTRINDHAIELIDDCQLSYCPFYNLCSVKLETLKIYIKNNLVNDFIKPFKFLAETLIFFNKKLNGSLQLYIDYQGLNNLIIKYWYLLSLIRKSLDWLG